ncbi:hypothetical protein KsCSTR_34930 [Candidatus Kuenenia stuttgartiensis]|uniref:Uncharacterized protein n=1 Tax=Kuenenia stuttgartiensis TaxID=174633 RepID=A0A6G7GU42_KUEST|nr:hypothetical protein [Candidatus Kuenenia stuttgartiensis]QII12872.1 hypothetical protein KsCSTR_34930 [Candidatus Kuenenia stuttgartiensis]
MKNIAQKETRKQPKIKTEMNGKGLQSMQKGMSLECSVWIESDFCL